MESQLEYNEYFNRQHAKNILNLTYDEYISKFKPTKTFFSPASTTTKTHLKYLKRWIRKYINKKIITSSYKFSKSQNNGRIYIKGFGIQCVSGSVKKYLLHDMGYTDYDMINCHPVILSYLCKKHNIKCPTLNEYINDRKNILEKNDITKTDVIMALYTDKNNNPSDNKYIKKIHREMLAIKKEINEIYKKYVNITINSKNKISSLSSHILNFYENKILQIAMRQYKNDIRVPYYDGFIAEGNNIKIEDLNEITKKYNIKWSIKPMVNNIDLGQIVNDETRKNDPDRVAVVEYFNKIHEQSQYGASVRLYDIIKSSAYNGKWVYFKKEKSSIWYEYNENNILFENYEPPPQLQILCTELLTNELEEYYDKAIKLFSTGDEQDQKKLEFIEVLRKSWRNNYGSRVYKMNILKDYKNFIIDEDIQEKIDSKRELVAFKNITYDFNILKYRNIERDDYVKSHIDYDKPEEDLQIQEKIMGCFKTIFNEDEMVSFFLDTISYPLFTNKFQKIYIWTGCGSNGKGIISTLMKSSLGSYYYPADNKFLTTKKTNSYNSSLANCAGKTHVMVCEPDSDLKGDTIINLGLTKMITGEPVITTRDLHKSNVTFLNLMTAYIQINGDLELPECNFSEMRRFMYILFGNKFVDEPDVNKPHEKKIDRNLSELFQTKQYYQQFILMLIKHISTDEKMNADKLNIPQSVLDKTASFFEDNNIVKQFINDKCKISHGRDIFTPYTELYNFFTEYENFNGMSKKAFKYNMKCNSYPYERCQKNGKSQRGFYGISYDYDYSV
jgi:phage/plasmid-associated DNA primase